MWTFNNKAGLRVFLSMHYVLARTYSLVSNREHDIGGGCLFSWNLGFLDRKVYLSVFLMVSFKIKSIEEK